MEAGLYDFPKERRVGVGRVEWIVWDDEQSLTKTALKRLIKNETPIKVKWPSIDERRKKSTEKISQTVDAILLSTGSWEDMSKAREDIDKYGTMNPTKEDRKTICQVSQNKAPKIHGNSRRSKELQATLPRKRKIEDTLTEKEKLQAKNATQVKKLHKEESQRQIMQEIRKKNEFLDDILDSDNDLDTLDDLKQRNRALVIENRRLREIISGIDGYEKILSSASQLEGLLSQACIFFARVVPEQSSPKTLLHKADGFFTNTDNKKSAPSKTQPPKTQPSKPLKTPERDERDFILDGQDSCPPSDKPWADSVEPTTSEDHDNDALNHSESENQLVDSIISEYEEASDIENKNIAMDKPQDNPFSVDPMKLKSCNKSKVNVYIPELLAVLFTETELSTSSLTGQVSNLHKNRKTGIREKKKLDPERVEFFYKCVCEHFPDEPKKKITEKLKAKLRYEAQKAFGYGFKTEKKPSNKPVHEKPSK